MRIGIVVSRQGPAGLWAPTCDACTMLAAAEVNASGGVLDREVELVLADAGTHETAAGFAGRSLVEIEHVDAVIGMHPSNLRGAMTQAIAGRVPYIYAPMYEGGEASRNVLAIGGTDDEILGHAVPWLMAHRHAERFFIFGNDYLWPRRAALAAAGIVAAHGGRVVGRSLVPFGTEDYGAAFAELRRARPDVVITLLLGEESVRFNRAFAASGLDKHVLRLALAVDETVLYAAGDAAHENMYVATTYVAGAEGPRSETFRELYRSSFGAGVPPATVYGQSCYDSVRLLATLAHSGRRPNAQALRRRFSSLADRRAGRRALPDTLIAAGGQVHLAEARGVELAVVASL